VAVLVSESISRVLIAGGWWAQLVPTDLRTINPLHFRSQSQQPLIHQAFHENNAHASAANGVGDPLNFQSY
jgi:hypothetical protein